MDVFAATGAGKSLLTRYEIIPFVKAAGYKVLIFDWKGSDYAPFFANRFEVSDMGASSMFVIWMIRSCFEKGNNYLQFSQNSHSSAEHMATGDVSRANFPPFSSVERNKPLKI